MRFDFLRKEYSGNQIQRLEVVKCNWTVVTADVIAWT